MMHTFVFLTGQYLPKPGATGMCVHQVAKFLAEKGHDVTTVCFADGDDTTQKDGVNIVKIPVPAYFTDAQTNNALHKKWIRLQSQFSKLLYLPKYPLRSSALVKRYADAVTKVIAGQQNVTVVASYVPLEAVASLELIKRRHKNAKIVYYSTDTLSNEQGASGILPAQMRENMGFRWEDRLFSCCDRIMIMECHKAHYFAQRFAKHHSKMCLASFPFMEAPKQQNDIDGSDTKTMVYAGTLYRTLRNPQFICSVLCEALKDVPQYRAIFMGSGDCDDIMEKACEGSEGKISYLGMQPYTVAAEKIASADVLLSIGNAESPMMPSKIFECMATGKPIVHVYSWEKDPCLEPLRKYGNALLLKENQPDAAARLLAFLASPVNMPYPEVEELFYTATPKYTADKIEEI